jgi:hypothetical protein
MIKREVVVNPVAYDDNGVAHVTPSKDLVDIWISDFHKIYGVPTDGDNMGATSKSGGMTLNAYLEEKTKDLNDSVSRINTNIKTIGGKKKRGKRVTPYPKS